MRKERNRGQPGVQLPDLAPEPASAPEPAGHEGGWGGVVEAFARVAAEASGVPGGAKTVDALVDLLRAIHRVQDDQAAMLNAIQQDVELLRTTAYNSALFLMSEAARVGPDDDHYAKFLDQAALDLFQAHASCASLEEQSVVEFHPGS